MKIIETGTTYKVYGEDLVVLDNLPAQTYKVGFGQSMTPILKSGQPVICKPVTEDTELKKNDIVLCKVKSNYYLHKISAIKNGVSYQISNNHGHINGTITRSNIFGIVVEIL